MKDKKAFLHIERGERDYFIILSVCCEPVWPATPGNPIRVYSMILASIYRTGGEAHFFHITVRAGGLPPFFVTVIQGPCGTCGTTTKKKFAESPWDAIRFFDNAIAKKIKSGYTVASEGSSEMIHCSPTREVPTSADTCTAPSRCAVPGAAPSVVEPVVGKRRRTSVREKPLPPFVV